MPSGQAILFPGSIRVLYKANDFFEFFIGFSFVLHAIHLN